ncbi:hypothetical protein [Devosia sp. DBB001]|nr:hypothetical protein [Devosia sp. DBB001]
MVKRLWAVLAGLALCCAPAQAQAQSFGLSEVRVGVAAHDAYNGFLPFTSENYRFNGITDLSFDAIFRSPDLDAFRWIGSPRPRIGATVSMQGLDSIAHAGLLWQVPLGDTFYVEAGFGAAINTGSLGETEMPSRRFGCRIGFYESFGVGANLSPSATMTLTYEHTSNNGYCPYNDGLSNIGLRIGFKF